jgi:hypothetical protein
LVTLNISSDRFVPSPKQMLNEWRALIGIFYHCNVGSCGVSIELSIGKIFLIGKIFEVWSIVSIEKLSLIISFTIAKWVN